MKKLANLLFSSQVFMVPVAALYILLGGVSAAYAEYFGLPHYGYYALAGLALGAISVAYMVRKKKDTTNA